LQTADVPCWTAGADILFIDALASVEEMRALGGLSGAAAGVPKVSR
jgi:2-methylisocitrate lyase-like PEP mutase family enzyme